MRNYFCILYDANCPYELIRCNMPCMIRNEEEKERSISFSKELSGIKEE